MKILHDITAVNSSSATTEASGYPIENAIDIKNFKEWRSTTLSVHQIVINFTGSIDTLCLFGCNFSTIIIGGVTQTLIKDDLTGDYRGFFPDTATSARAINIPAQTCEDSYYKISAIVIGNETALNNVVYPFSQQLVNPTYKNTNETGYPSKKSKGQNYRLISIKRDNLDYSGIGDLSEIKQSIKKSQTFVLFADDSNVGECYLGTRVESFEYKELSNDYGSDSLVLEETGGKPVNIRTLIEISLTGSTLYYALESLKFPVSSPVQYKRMLLSTGSIKDSLQDDFRQFTSLSTTTITLNNLDSVVEIINDSENLRGKTVNIKIVDLDTDLVIKNVAFTIEGLSFDNEKASLNLQRAELDLWHVVYPNEKFNLTDWSNIPDGSSAIDIGIPEYYGENRSIPCYYVLEDEINDYYDYVVGKTRTDSYESCDNVYHAGILASPSLYTFYDGSQVSPYPGYSFIRFDGEQKGFQGELLKITADIKGYKISSTYTENPVTCFKHWLEGIGLTVNASSFTAAETIATSLSLKVGGGIFGEKEAIDWREEWKLACRGALFTKGLSGYEIEIPVYQSTNDADFTEDNIIIKSRGESKVSSFVNDITTRYYFSQLENSYLKDNTQSCGQDFGTTKDYDLLLVNDDETASKISQYLRNTFLYSDKTMEVEAGLDAAELVEGNIIGITHSNPIIDNSRWWVKSITRQKSKVQMSLKEYSEDIFDWTTESYQATPPSGDALTVPSDVSSLVVTASKDVQNDGAVRSIFTVTFTPPTSNFDHAKMFIKADGGTYSEAGNCSDGRIVISGLTAGIQYYIKAVSSNGYLSATGIESSLTLAIGDTTAPDQILNVATLNGNGEITISWDASTASDLKTYRVYRNSSAIGDILGTTFTDKEMVYEVSQDYYVTAIDNSNNESVVSATVSGTASTFQDEIDGLTAPDDITNLVVTPSAELQSDGSVLSRFTITFTPPASNFTHARVVQKLTADSTYQDVGNCVDGEIILNGFTAGESYDFKVIAVNVGIPSSGVVSAGNTAIGDTDAPSQITNVSAVGGLQEITISWDASTADDLKFYRVYRGGTTSGFRIAEIAGTTFIDTEMTVGSSQTYYVTAEDNSSNESVISASDSATATSFQNGVDGLTAPADITALSITPDSEIQEDGTLLSWFDITFTPPVANFTHAQILNKISVGGTYQEVGNCTDGETRINGLIPGETYKIKVIAVNVSAEATGVESADTVASGDTTAPAVPVYATFSVTNKMGQVELDWADNTEDDFSHYEIHRDSVKIAEARVSKFYDNPPLYATNYSYQILAVDNTGNSSALCTGRNGQKTQVVAADITAGTITADEITVSSLDALSANVGTLTAGTLRYPATGTATFSINLTTGVVTVNQAGGLLIGGSGDITLAEGGDIIFEDCCILDASDTDMRIYPTDTSKNIFIGSAADGRWDYARIETTTQMRFLSLGDVDIYAGTPGTHFISVDLYNATTSAFEHKKLYINNLTGAVYGV